MIKRKYVLLFVAVFSLLGYTSCYKDGDLDGFGSPFRLELDPVVGLPLVKTSIDAEKMLGLLDNTGILVEFGENDEVLLKYSDSTRASMSTQAKSSIVSDVVEGEFEVDLFENMALEDFEFELESVFLNLEAYSITEINLPMSISDLVIKMHFDNGSSQELLKIDELSISDLTEGIQKVLDSQNVSSLLNHKPNKFSYSFNLEIDLAYVTSATVDLPEEIVLDFFFDLEIPLSLKASNIKFMDTINFNLDLDLDNVDFDDSRFILEFDNGLPLNLKLKLDVVDSNYVPLYSFFDSVYNIKSSVVDDNGFSSTSRISKEDVNFDSGAINAINNGAYIILSTSLSTSEGGKIVTVRKNDALGLNLGVVLHPIYSDDFDVIE